MPAPKFIMVHPAAPGFAYAVQAVVRKSGFRFRHLLGFGGFVPKPLRV